MKNLLRVGMALLVIAMMFGMAGCFEPEEGDTDVADFRNYTGADRAITIRNDSGVRVVLFAKSVAKENLIGGVPPTENHGISRGNNPAHFNTTAAFPVLVVTEKNYKDNMKDLSKIEPLTKIFVFYNKDGVGTNDNVYSVSGRLGGNQTWLEVTMPVTGTWNVELRDGGIAGPALGYAQAGNLHTRLFIQPGQNFNLFPVFHRWNPIREVLDAVYPRNASNEAVQYGIALNAGDDPYRINLRTVLDGVQARPIDAGAAYVIVQNTVENGMIHMLRGGQPIRNAVGISLFRAEDRVFTFKMAETMPGSGSFAPSTAFTGVSVGADGHEQALRVLREGETTATVPGQGDTVALENNKVYILSVSGDAAMNPAGIVPILYLNTTGLNAVAPFAPKFDE